jgi:hypothetical protein
VSGRAGPDGPRGQGDDTREPAATHHRDGGADAGRPEAGSHGRDRHSVDPAAPPSWWPMGVPEGVLANLRFRQGGSIA